jgi:hypothetical protein
LNNGNLTKGISSSLSCSILTDILGGKLRLLKGTSSSSLEAALVLLLLVMGDFFFARGDDLGEAAA